jgi:DNA-binding PadR family transcriptional regulator
MAKLRQGKENELPFVILGLFPKDRTGLQWTELWIRAKNAGIGSSDTFSKYLKELLGQGFVEKRVESSRKGAPVVYAITENGLAQLELGKPRKRLMAVMSREVQLDTYPPALKSRLDTIQKSQKFLRGAAYVAKRISFNTVPAKASSIILLDPDTAKDATRWLHSSLLQKLAEHVVDSILRARYQQISGGKVTGSFREESEWITEAFSFQTQLIIDFDGRNLATRTSIEKVMREAERERKMDDSNLDSFKKELLDPSKRAKALESLVANLLQWLTDTYIDVSANDLVKDVRGFWKDAELPNPPKPAEILKMWNDWEQGGIITTTHGEIRVSGKIAQKHPERADDVIFANAHMHLEPPWGKAKS